MHRTQLVTKVVGLALLAAALVPGTGIFTTGTAAAASPCVLIGTTTGGGPSSAGTSIPCPPQQAGSTDSINDNASKSNTGNVAVTGNGSTIRSEAIGIPVSPIYTLIQANNGTTVAAAVGQSVALSLPSAQMSWSVSVSNPSVLVPATGPLPTGDEGFWQAAAAGQAVVTANGRPVCNPGSECPQFIVHFQATVDVSGGS